MPSVARGTALRSTGAAIAALVALTTVAGCQSSHKIAYSPQDLKKEVATRVPTERLRDIVVPYQPTPEMVGRAKRYTDDSTTSYARADRLVRAVTSPSQFGVTWVPVTTTSAVETLQNKRGNCLSMTSLFIGLARGVGLTAYYVDASDRVNEISRDDELIVDTGHIAATVLTERGWSLVDFTGEISEYRTFRIIDDVEALAHFYNNRGFEAISQASAVGEEIPWDVALGDFMLATYVKEDFARAQNNRGVAHSRLEDVALAETAYKAAVAADDSFAAPRHNLGNLHLRRGEFDSAIRWYTLAIKLQGNNPYAHYHLGLARYQAGDVEGSIESFKRAIALKHDYLEPRNLLAQAYRHQGRIEEAERVRKGARQKSKG